MNTLPPPHTQPKETLAFSSDHGGLKYKELLKKTAQKWGYSIIDYGTYSSEPVDYPDYIVPVVKEVLAGAKGVMICGSGIGMSIGANRFKGIRAAICYNRTMAKLAREHNNANILVLGERLIDEDEAIACLKAFLTTPFEGGRHTRRVEKLEELSSP